ncbi:MAG: aminotransferase class V-fold PLP-dependent enzyme, partial [Bacteroidota bacterium]
TVVVLHEQFPNHVYPWRRIADEAGATMVAVEPPGPLGTPGRAAVWNARLLEAITPETGLVAVPNIHWSDGTVFDLEAVGARAREVGAAFVVDGTQSVGALPFDWRTVRPDALAVAGYKWLLGPLTMGVLVLGDRFHEGRPLEETWVGRQGARQFSGLTTYVDAYEPGAARFDVGERSNGVLLPWLTAGIEQLLAWGVAEVQATLRPLADRISEGARAKGYGVGEAQAAHLFGLLPPDGLSSDEVRAHLAERGVAVSARGSVVRVAPHVYNTEADADALVEALPEAA